MNSKEIGVIEEKIRSFNSKFTEMETKYYANQAFTLKQLIEQTTEEFQRCIEDIGRDEDLQEQLNQKSAELERETTKLETHVEHEQTVIQSLNDNYDKQLKIEIDAAVKLQPFAGVPLPYHTERYILWLRE